MKVAIIDNTCNNGYVLMRYLNDRGIDTDLLLFSQSSGHGDPENDSFNKQYFNKIIDTGWSTKGLLWLTRKDINIVLDKYDFVIGSDYAPAIFSRIKRRLNIFFPHGTDLFNYPFARINELSRRSIGEWILARWQRKGISKYTEYFWFEKTIDEFEKYMDYFKNSKFKRIYKTIPLVYYPQYTTEAVNNFAEQNDKVKQLKKLKESGNILLFHHCQQQWKNPVHLLFNKGNDKLIRGLKKFITLNPSVKNIKLIMIERGTDVEASKKLIKDLGIEDHIIWFSFMPRKEILACLAFVDLGIGELGHSYFTYSVATEFMIMSVPIIHYCDIDYYKTVHESVYPMYSANSPNEICQLIEDYYENPTPFKITGKGGQEWWKKNIASEALDYIIDRINSYKEGSRA